MILENHLFSLCLYAALTSVVMAVIRRVTLRDRVRYGAKLFLIMTLGAIAFGWFMFLFIKR